MATLQQLERPPVAIPFQHRWPADVLRSRRGTARRGLNVVVAAIGILLTLPLMLLIAVAIKLTSRGPILYRQTRIGLGRRRPGRAGGNTRRHVDYGGRPFTIYKFRTMYVDRSDGTKQV